MEINGQHLNASAMYLANKITMLQKKKGYCWASNQSLADMLDLSPGYISHQLTALERAGKIYRLVERDERTGEVVSRKLYAFKTVQDTAKTEETIKALEQDMTEDGQKRRLVANGLNLCISPMKVIGAINQFGIERVDEALSIVKASQGTRNPVRFFYKALYKAWKAGKRASSYIGTAFTGARRRTASTLREEAKAGKKIKYVLNPDDFNHESAEWDNKEASIKERLEELKARVKPGLA